MPATEQERITAGVTAQALGDLVRRRESSRNDADSQISKVSRSRAMFRKARQRHTTCSVRTRIEGQGSIEPRLFAFKISGPRGAASVRQPLNLREGCRERSAPRLPQGGRSDRQMEIARTFTSLVVARTF